MTAITRIQDLLGIYLVLSERNIDNKLADMVKRADLFQEEQNRHFGITRSDFCNLFFRVKYFSFTNIVSFDKFLEQTTLKEICRRFSNTRAPILPMRENAGTNKGEHGDFYIQHIFAYNDEEYKAGLLKKQAMVDFLSNSGNSDNAVLVKEFMVKAGITKALLYGCSREGDNS